MRLKNYFIEERNIDLLNSYRRVLSNNSLKTQEEAVALSIECQSSKFWVTPECAAKAVSRILKGDKLAEMKEHRIEMFFEIHKRYIAYKQKYAYSDKSIVYICTIIVEEKAPKFYLEKSTAYKLITKERLKHGKNISNINNSDTYRNFLINKR